MQEPRFENPPLTGEDWALLAQVLEARQNALLVEIRHTSHRTFREELRGQLRRLESLLDRIPTHQEKE